MTEATVMARLRAETKEHHERAEHEILQQRMARAEVSRDEYVAWLGQMLHVHRTLERALRAHADDPRFRAVRPEQYQEPYLLDDLAHLGVDVATIVPCTATADLEAAIESTASASPVGLLGYHYVLEGSNNGNRFIARRLREPLGLEGGGLRYLDPYGEDQRAKWAQFKADMDAVAFSEAERDEIVQRAGEMFDGIGAISRALVARKFDRVEFQARVTPSPPPSTSAPRPC